LRRQLASGLDSPSVELITRFLGRKAEGPGSRAEQDVTGRCADC